MYPSKNQGEPAREKQNTDSKSPNRTTIQRSNKNDLQTENVVAEEYVNKETKLRQNKKVTNALQQKQTTINAQIEEKTISVTHHSTLLLFEKKFFLTGPKTPNLMSIFPAIEPAKLKRTSSAIWNKTEMSTLASSTNVEESDED
ncbi:hypothetical protein FQA39_LY18638 [Lamprigera yunnana]|nr:hypothetical protein FQA39_LY18638 [Lamprigera yunnana]